MQGIKLTQINLAFNAVVNLCVVRERERGAKILRLEKINGALAFSGKVGVIDPGVRHDRVYFY